MPRFTITELFYSHIYIFLIWREAPFIQQVSGVYMHFSVSRYRWAKNGFTGPKSFRGFRQKGPQLLYPTSPSWTTNVSLPIAERTPCQQPRKGDIFLLIRLRFCWIETVDRGLFFWNYVVSLDVRAVNGFAFHAIWVRLHAEFTEHSHIRALRIFFGQGRHSPPSQKAPVRLCQ